jgi:hypothetical protein
MGYTIKRLSGNQLEVTNDSGTLTVMVSYETPVAVKNGAGFVARTKTRFSRSTEAQLRKYIASAAGELGSWEQNEIDRALIELTGSDRLYGYTRAGQYERLMDTRVNYDDYTEQGDRNLVITPGAYR